MDIGYSAGGGGWFLGEQEQSCQDQQYPASHHGQQSPTLFFSLFLSIFESALPVASLGCRLPDFRTTRNTKTSLGFQFLTALWTMLHLHCFKLLT
jgi:hypothetical protein